MAERDEDWSDWDAVVPLSTTSSRSQSPRTRR
jgi:hypothetical protein